MAKAEAWVMIPKLDKDKTGCVLEMYRLVLCKDCKHQDPDRVNDGSDCFVCRKGHGWKPDNWFCADGEMR